MSDAKRESNTQDVTCPHCGTEWELSPAEAELSTYFCEDCKTEFDVAQGRLLSMQKSIPATDSNLPKTNTHAHNYLRQLRVNSCYPTLRLLIVIGAILSFVMLCGYILFIVCAANANNSVPAVPAYVAALALATIGSVFIIISAQTAVLLIDFADSHLDKNSREK